MFGNPEPGECEIKAGLCRIFAGVFGRSDRYSVTRPSRETIYGSAREFNWQRRVWQAALEQYERPDAALHNLVLPIDRRVLLQFLMEAVEEVQAKRLAFVDWERIHWL